MRTNTKSKGLKVQKERIDFAELWFQLHFLNYLWYRGFIEMVAIFFYIYCLDSKGFVCKNSYISRV